MEARLYKELCDTPPTVEYMDAFLAFDSPLKKPSDSIEDVRASADALFVEPSSRWFRSRLPEGFSTS